MTPRRIILGLILLIVVSFCGLAAAKLRATPKYDRIQVGMTLEEVGVPCHVPSPIEREWEAIWGNAESIECDEGRIKLKLQRTADGTLVTGKSITRRGPLERLAWLAGWR
jgi:hypothetical protein